MIIEIKDMIEQETFPIFEQLSKYIIGYLDRNYPQINREGRRIKNEGRPMTFEQVKDILNDNLDSKQEENRAIVNKILQEAMYDYLSIIGKRNLNIMKQIDSGDFNTEEVSDEKDYINGINYILAKLSRIPHPLEELRKPEKDRIP